MSDGLLEFPCDFPVKIMGLDSADFVPAVLAVVIEHAADFDPACAKTRASRGGKYVSLTCTIRARSQVQLDALYRALSSHPLVKVAL